MTVSAKECEGAGSGSEAWSGKVSGVDADVEVVRLRHGLELVLSRFGAGPGTEFHFVEPEDVVGIGYHLIGGAHFDVAGQHFATQALDIWAVAAPKHSTSVFSIPKAGFRTVSLRMTPDTARTLLDEGNGRSAILGGLIGMCAPEAHLERRSPISGPGAARIKSMLNPHYTGSARRLFLESCVLGILADELNTNVRLPAPVSVVQLSDRRRMFAARDCLEARLDNPPSTLALARELGVNDFKLKRDFKESFGETLFGYVRRRRLERASLQLVEGRSVQETAFAAGYECPRCFADAFRRQFGVLPRDVSRASLRVGKAPGSRT